MKTAREIIDRLRLERHPEGGWYRETWRAPEEGGVRGAGSAIYYLLEGDQYSHWHRLDAAVIWLWHAGAPLAHTLSPNGHDAESRIIGPEFEQGQAPQLAVPAGCWQTSASLGRYTLLSCVVAPAFEFQGFEMAPPNWRPLPQPPKD